MAERNLGIYNRLEPYEKKLARDRILNSTLSDICLNSIVKHFDRHMVAHNSGRIPKHYEFLQRAASKKLFDILYKNDDAWPSTYRDFLINPYMKELSTSPFGYKTGFPFDNIFAISKTLTKLDIVGPDFTEDLLCQLAQNLPNVKFLTISYTPLSPRVLQNFLKHCTCLESFHTYGSVHDTIIQNVFDIQDAENEFPCKAILKEFLTGSHVTAVGIVYLLKYFPNLICLDNHYAFEAMLTIYSDNIRNNVLPAKVYKLTDLFLHCCDHLDAQTFQMCSVLCPYLVKLSLYQLQSQAQVDALVGFSTLEEVIFLDVDSDDISFSTFIKQNGKKLKVFKVLSPNYVNISAESLLEFCPNLEVLKIQCVVFEPMREEYLSKQKLNLMKHLTVASKLSLPSSIKSLNTILSSSPNLKVLDLSSCRSLSRNIDSIIANCSLNSIRELAISWTDIDEYDVQKILLAFSFLEKFTIPDKLFLEELQFVENLPPHINKVWIDKSRSAIFEWIVHLSHK